MLFLRRHEADSLYSTKKENMEMIPSRKILNCLIITAMAIVFLPAFAAAQNFAGHLQKDDSQENADALKGHSLEKSAAYGKISGQEPLQDLSRYTLGVEDVIRIEVLRHPEVSGEYIINKEGKIQYEFVGDVSVVGLTKDEVKDKLKGLLSTYILSPQVTVKITGYNSKVVYVIGEVGAPGKIYMKGDTITVREALIQARLPLLTAATRKCPLITPSYEKKPKKKLVNVFSLLYEGNLKENFIMKPGDTLYIPATIMAKTMRVLSPVTEPVGAAAGTGRTVTTGF